MVSVLPRYFNDKTKVQRQHYAGNGWIPPMNMESAISQVFYLLIAPERVYRGLYYHKQTKNQWARDDPAFSLLIVVLLCLAAVAWGIVYGLGITGIVKTALCMVFIDFLGVGAFIATMNWAVANRFLSEKANAYTTEQKVEWAYAFDIHCNAFVPVYFLLYVLQFFFFRILQSRSWIALFIGNAIYCIASMWYMHVTYLGYHALPFLVHTELFRYPMLISLILFIVSLFGFNVSRSVLAFYFH